MKTNAAQPLLTNGVRTLEVRYTLFDLDNGFAIGPVETLSVDVFTYNPFELFCRLRDYLKYTKGIEFTKEQTESCFADPHPEDTEFGNSYMAIGTWSGKEFGIQFAM